jgi:sensory rhodopsin
VTTPLIVFYLAMLVEPARRTYLIAVAADVVMIGFGAVGNVLTPPLRYVAFAGGAAAFGYLSYLLYVRFERESTVDSMDRRALFEKLRNLTVVLWGVYPVVWLLSSTGVGLLLPATEEIVTIYLDVLTKAGFALIAVNGSETIDAGVSSALGADPADD